MTKRKLRGVLVDTETATIKIVTVEDNLRAFYEALHCDCIDIVSRVIAGIPVDIICDDEALLKNTQLLSAATPGRSTDYIYGSILVVGRADEEGNLTSLSPEQARVVKAKSTTIYQTNPETGSYLKLEGETHGFTLFPIILTERTQ